MTDERQLANAIRALAMDAVQQANSGHPGMPMGMADIATVLWRKFLKHNPKNPNWTNRDRFVLSNGHGAMLQYALLHLSGYDLSIDDLKNFRQLHSKTPGHPEYHDTPGVEVTTGPLGQGVAMGVGMALAEKLLAKQFNAEHDIVDHHTYVFLGDGCLMEGVSHEACSLAGTWKLGKLIAFYDDNNISIDGEVGAWFTDNTPARFRAYDWHVIENVDGHDHAALEQAIAEAKNETAKPTLICCKTTIGFGSPNLAGTAKSHGAPLGAEEIAATREKLGWEYAPFDIPQAIYDAWDATAKGAELESTWNEQFKAYSEAHAELAAELTRRIEGKLPADFAALAEKAVSEAQANGKTDATRKSSLGAINAFAPHLPELLGGSADLSGSNCTKWTGAEMMNANADGNYVGYGVREFGMSAIMNGLALHGGFIPYGGTFLVFSDYARNAIRLSALMQQKVLYVLTHDSIGLGEDGPTHQPVEHTSSLRLIPGLNVWRPCDVVETFVAWQQGIAHNGPSCLLFSRQGSEFQARDAAQVANIARGGYVLVDCDDPELILMATGTEVELATAAAKQLTEQGRRVRVVSMPCCDVFIDQDAEYRESVLPKAVTKRIAIEAGVTTYWWQFVGTDGDVIGIDDFGLSAPAKQVYAEFDITVDAVVEAAKNL